MLIMDMVSGYLHALKFINSERLLFIMSVKMQGFFIKKKKAKINTLNSKHFKSFACLGLETHCHIAKYFEEIMKHKFTKEGEFLFSLPKPGSHSFTYSFSPRDCLLPRKEGTPYT